MTVPVFPVVPTVQQYDWGKIGLQSKVAQFADAAGFKVDAKAPYAEVRRPRSFASALLKTCWPAMDGHPSEVAVASPRLEGHLI